MSSAISPGRHARRLDDAAARLRDTGVAVMLIGVGPELEWLVGYAAQGHERLNLLMLDAAGSATFIGPLLEEPAARTAPGLGDSSVRMVSWRDGQDPMPLVAEHLAGNDVEGRRMAVSDGLRAAFMLGLQRVLPGTSFEVASATLGPLRRVKDAEEVASSNGRPQGHWSAEAKPISLGRSGSGSSARDMTRPSSPSSRPGRIAPRHIMSPATAWSELVNRCWFDIGGRRAGYCSDITRMVWVAGEPGVGPDRSFVEIHGIVERAQAAGRVAVRPGVSLSSVDAAARDIIAAAGHGDRFIHRLGHGIGLEVHEEPYCVAGNDDLTVAGDTFSIEPGIYLEGRFGVRIEDAVVCTPNGVDSLNAAPRELTVVTG